MDGNMMEGGGGQYVGPQSPVDLKPETSNLLTATSPLPTTSYMSFMPGSGQMISPQGGNYPPSHPLSGAKHMCSICGDRASGKHYGVYSCEGCKGFFKRTVRKELHYACREERNCIVDKRQRNRCQYCRYMKCLSMGMKREAVQEERGVGKGMKEGGEGGDDLEGSMYSNDMPADRILEAEMTCERFQESLAPQSIPEDDMAAKYKMAANIQLQALVEWAKVIPHFGDLPIDDQVSLLRYGWNELMIAGFSHRSIGANEGIVLSPGILANRGTAHEAGVGHVYDRVLIELVGKFTEMKMDKTELGCLRCIVLFNPDAKGLTDPGKIEQLRERVYACLEDYVRSVAPTETGRFAKLLLRLPALRSIGLKCDEHLFFFKMITDSQQGNFEPASSGFEFHLKDLLENRCVEQYRMNEPPIQLYNANEHFNEDYSSNQGHVIDYKLYTYIAEEMTSVHPEMSIVHPEMSTVDPELSTVHPELCTVYPRGWPQPTLYAEDGSQISKLYGTDCTWVNVATNTEPMYRAPSTVYRMDSAGSAVYSEAEGQVYTVPMSQYRADRAQSTVYSAEWAQGSGQSWNNNK